MPMKPERPYRYPGCPAFSDGVYCEVHKRLYARENAVSRGYDGRWESARRAYLRRNTLCTACRQAGKLTPATVLDHIVPHRGDMQLFWDKKELAAPLQELP